ncbi:thermonuclease family protein [Porphyrobacter sp. GA68]|uniref:thermonuclease family protein n=1 Tax=Porphyrobacter sp. GA68 TaxID=2883480 RepID=UPI001D1876C9|nr:thermonuclease family protein [Porphyrobacter sp. GA68]
MRWRSSSSRKPCGAGPGGTGGLTGGGPLPRPARFGTPAKGRPGRLTSAWRWLALATLLALGALWLVRLLLPVDRREVPAFIWQPCADAPSRDRCVVDGDTIRLDGETVRIAGLDAPELAGRCEAERIAARAARDALIGWLSEGGFTSAPEPGGNDRYGRPLRILSRNGVSVADALVSRGVARPYAGEARLDWCAAEG